MKKAIFIGTSKALMTPHPFERVEASVRETFKGVVDLTCTTDPAAFFHLEDYDLGVIYWSQRVVVSEETISNDCAEAILDYVAAGGKLLILHHGISVCNNNIAYDVIKGKFLRHPKMQSITITASQPGHPIVGEVKSFDLVEEPYHFETLPGFPEPIYTYAFEDGIIPAAWEISHGKGHIVYLLPGHGKEQFDNASFRKLIVQSAKYLLGK